jgi:hypothetical protein
MSSKKKKLIKIRHNGFASVIGTYVSMTWPPTEIIIIILRLMVTIEVLKAKKLPSFPHSVAL